MSSGFSDSSSDKITTDTRVVRLRRRLGSLPEIVSKFGPPPQDVPKGRPLSESQPPLNKTQESRPDSKEMLDKAKERKAKQTEVGTRINGLSTYVDTYEQMAGNKADKSYR